MFSTKEFRNFAEDVVLFLHCTSRVDGEPQPNLLREKGGNGYPTVSFLAADGRVLRQQPMGALTVDGLRTTLQRLRAWQKLRARAERGDAGARRAVFLEELDLGMLSFAAAKKEFTALRKELPAAQRKRVASALVGLEFQSHLRRIDPRDRATMLRAGEQFVGMIEQGRIPRSQQIITFWQAALAYAEAQNDAKTFAKVLERAKQVMAGDPRAARYVQSVERRLQRLQDRGKRRN